MIAVGVADCVPLLLLDPVKRVAAVLHAGWKGSAANIAAKGVESLVKLFGSDRSRILAAIGPAIGPCCYEVDKIVCDAFSASGVDWAEAASETGAGKWQLDLAGVNRLQLLDSGLSSENIESADKCVSCDNDRFFSYRRDEGETGRQAGFIMLN
jgi:YfiH family protein